MDESTLLDGIETKLTEAIDTIKNGLGQLTNAYHEAVLSVGAAIVGEELRVEIREARYLLVRLELISEHANLQWSKESSAKDGYFYVGNNGWEHPPAIALDLDELPIFSDPEDDSP